MKQIEITDWTWAWSWTLDWDSAWDWVWAWDLDCAWARDHTRITEVCNEADRDY